MSNKKNLLLNIGSSLAQKVISLLYYFIIPILVIRHFGSEVNGLVSSITQFVSYISLLEMGIGLVVTYSLYKPLVKKNSEEIGAVLGAASNFFNKIGFCFLIYLCFLCIFYPRVINTFDYWYVFSLIIIISLNKLFEYFFGMIYALFLKADQKEYIINITNSISYIVNIVLMYILVKSNCSIQFVYLISSFSYILRPLILRLYFAKKYNYKVNKKTNYKLKQQKDCICHHIAFTVQSNTDVIILTLFSNIINVSIYAVYNVVTTGIRAISLSFTSGIEAMFGKILANENKEELKEKFNMYLFSYYTIIAIIFSCTLILIMPFIKVYTSGITDVNYMQHSFAYLIVFAELSYIIRLPFSNLAFAKGHFKQTSKFSIAEPIVNIILSVLLVKKYGLIGVAIGTLVSMLIRSLGFVIYTTKNILDMKLSSTLKYIIVLYSEIIVVFLAHLFIKNIFVNGYIQWIFLAFLVIIVLTFIIGLINIYIYKDVSSKVLERLFKHKRRK